LVTRTFVALADEKLREIEIYLYEVGEALPAPEPDSGLVPFLLRILGDDVLRVAFGFPKSSSALGELVSSGEAAVQPILGILAQRVNHLLWRFEYTLECIPAEWAARVKSRSEELRTICEPHLLARRPTLYDIAAALRFSKDLKAFSESAPDPTLYAVLRAFDHLASNVPRDQSAEFAGARATALDFLFDYLQDVIEERAIDDSSNAWWAVRIGICDGDARFLSLLPQVATKFSDVRIPPEEVSRLAAVPEIYKPVRTIAYTLSNAQAILEVHRAVEGDLRGKLHQVIHVMVDRLVKTPRSNQLYLASVHHEGLRNYLDFVQDQNLRVNLGSSFPLGSE
jgi:hypothetical protein